MTLMEAVEKTMDAQINKEVEAPDLSNVNANALYEQLLDKKFKELEKRLNENLVNLVAESAKMRGEQQQEVVQNNVNSTENSVEEGDKND